MSTLEKKELNLFLTVLIVSLIGNACADYALLWYGISKITQDTQATKDHTISLFYIGQAIGVIFLSPMLSVFFDRFAKFVSSTALDAAYALILVAMGICFKFDWLSAEVVFIAALITAALAILHKSSVGFSVVQKMSQVSGVTTVTAKFIAALNFSIFFGSIISGFAFQYLGFQGCLAIGILTFLPMPWVYYKIFKDEPKPLPAEKREPWFSGLKLGLSTLRSDRLLFWTAVSISVINVASAVLPAVVGIAFNGEYPGRTDLASMGISSAILAGILLTKVVGEWAKQFSTHLVIPLSILPASIMLIVCVIHPSAINFAIMFWASCIGSNARSVSSGSLRVTRVPKHLTGRVNTAYSALLYLGQSLGGLIVVQAVQKNLQVSAILIFAIFVAGGLIAFYSLPKERLSVVLGAPK